MFKQTKFYIGIALGVNAFVSLITFIALLAKKKSSAGIFGVVAAVCAAASAVTLYDYKKTCDDEFECCDCEKYDCDGCEHQNVEDDLDINENELFSRDEEENEG